MAPLPRYDPVGLGASGGDLSAVEFAQWVESGRAVLDQQGEQKNILVGKNLPISLLPF